MSSEAITVQGQTGVNAAILERVLLTGDLSGLSAEDRVLYYKAVCDSVGINPLTKPFDYLELDDSKGGKKLVLYTKKDCTDQLRTIHGVSIKIVAREVVEGIYVVTSHASKPDGRTDESIGAVPLVKEDGEWKTAQSGKRFFQGSGRYTPLPPDAKANAIMKAETKSKRRVTLSICGLGLIDESEIETIKGAQPLGADVATMDPKPEPKAPTKKPLGEFDAETFSAKLQAARQRLGDAIYWRVMGSHGYTDPSEIKKRAEAESIWNDFKYQLDVLKQRQMEVSEADIPEASS
jgi:hypothetical protein